MKTDILKLIDKDLRTCYVTDKLEVFEKTFCGRVWAFFHPDSLNSDKVASAIDNLMQNSDVLTGLTVKDRDKLAQNLENLATRFTLIKDLTRANRSSTSVFNSLQRLFDQVPTYCNPPLTAGAQRTRVTSLEQLPHSSKSVADVRHAAPARPPKGPVADSAPRGARLPKGISQADAARQAAPALHRHTSQEVTTVTRGNVRVIPNNDPLLVSRYLPPVDTETRAHEETTDFGANLHAQRAKMGLSP